MESKLLIGLTGPARTGKDTVAAILQHYHGFKRVAFADPIRNFVAYLVGVQPHVLMDGKFKEQPLKWLGGKSPRFLMQTLGTEWGRQMVDRNLWLNVAMDKVEEAGDLVVVSDVRFENEASAIRERGGFIWHIERPGATQVNAHVSETGVQRQLFDEIIHNDGELHDLQRRVDELFVKMVAL